jgi:phage-related protein
MGDSLGVLRGFPDEVKYVMGFALRRAQEGKKHEHSKPLRGFRGAGVLEVVEDFDGNAYRAVYTVKLQGAVYVLHAFQKKSKRGSATPKAEIDLVKSRLRLALEAHAAMESGK